MAKKRHTKSNSKKGISGVVAAVIIIVAAIVIVSVINSTPAGTEVKEDTTEDTTEEVTVEGSTVVVIVNGREITQDDIDEELQKLPEAIRSAIDSSQIEELLISRALLDQEAKKLGIEVTEEDIQEVIDDIKNQNGLSEEEMAQILGSQGSSFEIFKDDVRIQVKEQKLYEVAFETEVTEKEIQEAYDTLKPSRVRHILLAPEENETEEQLLERALLVQERIDEDLGNFCDLVTELSVDVASTENCGEYEVSANGQYVPEFEQAASDFEEGQVAPVVTQFGVHIIWKVENIPIEDYTELLEEQLSQEKNAGQIQVYLDGLRENAVIVYPEADGNLITGNVVLEDEIVIEEEVIINIDDLIEEEEVEEEIIEEVTEEEVVEEVEGEIEEVVKVPEVIEEEETTEEEVVEEVIEEEPEVIEEEEVEEETPATPPQFTGVVTEDFVQCLSNEGVKLYGAHWDSQTKSQLQMFPGTPSFYNECFQQGDYKNKLSVCSSVIAFPSWEISGQMMIGKLSINSLIGLTGC